jgi:hypothetical protein
MTSQEPFYIKYKNIYAIPLIHYNMEIAAQVKFAFDYLKPDCVAVELPESMQKQMIHAASRLPDLSLIVTENQEKTPLYFFCEPCDGAFEGLRSALENGVHAYCIDLDIDEYPDIRDPIPDPYSIQRIGLSTYYKLYKNLVVDQQIQRVPIDTERETYMARRLKELSLSYDRILFIVGMNHLSPVLKLISNSSFPNLFHADREQIQVCTLTEQSSREVMAEWGWLTAQYEAHRGKILREGPLDRQKLILQLYKEAAELYKQSTGHSFPGYHLRNIMKFVRNYSLIGGQLMPDLFKILSAAKGCVDHNYAYETWNLATFYSFRKNIDNLPELNLSASDIWGHSKTLSFHRKEKGKKDFLFPYRKDRSTIRFTPPSFFTICSYPPEDIAIERFSHFLKKKGYQLLTEESARVIPFSTSLEDGIDTRETIRHWHEKKLYVKAKGKPPAEVGSVCVIFDEDKAEEGKHYQEKYPWKTTWLGEHNQESDMAFYSTSPLDKVIGPGISRCEYGGFMMSYPPRRMKNVWTDPDYQNSQTKAEVLLMSAIDYAVKPTIVYVASTPPKNLLKSFASRFGKKIVYIPIGQLSPLILNKLRVFHLLDGHDKRKIADEYIY